MYYLLHQKIYSCIIYIQFLYIILFWNVIFGFGIQLNYPIYLLWIIIFFLRLLGLSFKIVRCLWLRILYSFSKTSWGSNASWENIIMLELFYLLIVALGCVRIQLLYFKFWLFRFIEVNNFFLIRQFFPLFLWW